MVSDINVEPAHRQAKTDCHDNRVGIIQGGADLDESSGDPTSVSEPGLPDQQKKALDPRDLEAADVILLYRINTAWTPKAYAILERSILRAWPAMGMGPGALVLLLFMLRTTERRPGEDPRHLTKPPHHNWPAATGRSWRSTMRDITELEAAGFVTRVGKDHRGRTRHRINLEPMRRKAAATYARLGYRMTAADGDTWPVPFWPLHVLSDAPDLLWLWWAYASYDTGARTSKAWPSQARLVAWAGSDGLKRPPQAYPAPGGAPYALPRGRRPDTSRHRPRGLALACRDAAISRRHAEKHQSRPDRASRSQG